MQKDALNNVHITDEQVLMTPEQLKAAFPLSLQQEAQIADSRKTISDIIAGRTLPNLLWSTTSTCFCAIDMAQ
ncbi:hypothetical protein ACUOCP_14420, partial [Escherichia sp. R-CC3]